MSSPAKVLFLVNTLSVGGAEGFFVAGGGVGFVGAGCCSANARTNARIIMMDLE